MSIIRFIFISNERNSILLKNLNIFEEEKISLLEKEIERSIRNNNESYISQIHKNNKNNIDNIASCEIPKILYYYPESKTEILKIISRIDIWYYLGNFFFSFLIYAIIFNKSLDFEINLFPSSLAIMSISKIVSN